MAAYTYSPAPVLVEATGELAIGATGQLLAADGSGAVPVYDLNDSLLASILVGPKGVHQAFKADIPNGVLDFGSVLLPTISQEALAAALTVQQATTDLTGRVDALEQGTVSGFGRVVSMSRLPTASDANPGDVVLVNPSFF